MEVSRHSKLENNYKYGFTTDIESEQIPKGINEDTVRLISSIKKEVQNETRNNRESGTRTARRRGDRRVVRRRGSPTAKT